MKFISWIVGGVALLIGLGGGYYWGLSTGQQQAQADIAGLQQQLAEQAGADAAKTANPFQQVNPLEGVQTNPFEEAQKALNPFEQ